LFAPLVSASGTTPLPHLHRDWAHRLAPKVRGHIFDVDGTLIDTMPMFYPVWPEAGKKVPQLHWLTPAHVWAGTD
jgi:hypothetical protein